MRKPHKAAIVAYHRVTHSDRVRRAIIKGAIVSHCAHAFMRSSWTAEGAVYVVVGVAVVALHLIELDRREVENS